VLVSPAARLLGDVVAAAVAAYGVVVSWGRITQLVCFACSPALRSKVSRDGIHVAGSPSSAASAGRGPPPVNR
jgi:hypothetical protein